MSAHTRLTNLTEFDPERIDIGFWRAHWKRTRIQGIADREGRLAVRRRGDWCEVEIPRILDHEVVVFAR